MGTFRDVRALVKKSAEGANFADMPAMQVGRSHLQDLGIDALELLPIADSYVDREWGYATSNYFTPDYDLGFPEDNTSPTSNTDLAALVAACHEHDIRFIVDTVMAFGTHATMENVNFAEFHIDPGSAAGDDPDRLQSSRNNEVRDGFGGKLWRYARPVTAYDPVDGGTRSLFPARQLMKAQILRWMSDFVIDGIRIDSVNNIANWDFVKEFRDLARSTWSSGGGAPDKFIVVGEELSVPHGLVTEHRLDALWNEDFKRMVRYAILGQNDEREPSFEWTVRKLIDCRLMGFGDGAEAGQLRGQPRRGRVPQRAPVQLPAEQRGPPDGGAHQARVHLPTDGRGHPHDLRWRRIRRPARPEHQQPGQAAGRGQLRAGGRAVPQKNLPIRLRLVKFRIASNALAVNDTDFIRVDFNDGKRVLVWKRGTGSDVVVVVANFSDFDSGRAGSTEYRVPNWPATPPGKHWRDVSQDRDVDPAWVGREAIFPWEAKVYALV